MYGVCVIKKFINNCENEQILFSLLYLFMKNFLSISENQFGNYAIQIFIEKIANKEKYFSLFQQNIIFNFIRLSVNRFGSRVIECFIDKIDNKKRIQILRYLLQSGYHNQIISNKYGKYVILKLLNEYEGVYNTNMRNIVFNVNNNINKDKEYIF